KLIWPGPTATFLPPETSISPRRLSVITNWRLGPVCHSLVLPGALRLNSTPIALIISVELHLNLFGVTQAVRTRVDACHHDRVPPLGGDDIRLGMGQPP